MEALIHSNERLDDLCRKGYRLIQDPKLFCFGIDAVHLYDYAKVKRGERAVDLCTGNGVIPILLEAKNNGEHYSGLELQPQCADLAKRSVKYAKSTAKATKQTIKSPKKTAKTSAKAAKITAKAARAAAKAAAQATRLAVKAAIKAIILMVKAAIAAIKGLIAAIAAGGWVVVLILLLIGAIAVILLSPFGIFSGGRRRRNAIYHGSGTDNKW